MNDPFNQAPKPTGPAQDKQERLAVRVEIVEKPTPEALRAIKELRILASEDERDAFMLVTTKDKEEGKNEEDLIKEMFSDDGFVVLLWNETEPVAMGRADKYKEKGEGVWYLGSDYVKKTKEKSYRGYGLAKKIMATRLDHIRKIGGTRAIGGIKKLNDENLGLSSSFFFETTGETRPGPEGGWVREVDLNKPELIKRIEEVLNSK